MDTIASFQSFRKHTNASIQEFSKLIKEYGSFSEIPIELLGNIKFNIQKLLIHYETLKYSLQETLYEAACSLNQLKKDALPNDIISTLYERKYVRIKKQLAYFENIEGISTYVSLNLKNRLT